MYFRYIASLQEKINKTQVLHTHWHYHLKIILIDANNIIFFYIHNIIYIIINYCYWENSTSNLLHCLQTFFL